MSCTDVQTIQAGNGSKTQFSFDFPYIFKSEIHVYFWNVTTKEYDEKLTTDGTYPWQITDANPTIVEFTSTAPPTPTAPTDPGEPTVDNVKIRRITKVDDIRALFNPGSAIRSDDLNRNFEQLRYAIQESGCQGIPDDVDAYLKTYYWNKFDDVVYAADTWPTDASADQKIATIASMDQRFQDETTETFTKAELAAASDVLPDNDTAVTTTGTVKDYVDHVVETDILVDGTGLNKTGASGQVTIGIAAGSVDLDRIKAADIIASGEANPNNDTTIATTAKIDDMIDAAVTGDIAGSDGVSITNDGDGTITVGLSAGSVDFDRIKAADIITEAEQNTSAAGTSSGNTTNVADTSVFTSSAAARRFDTLVQLGTPTGSDWETGKGWLQPNSESIFSVWNGLSWTTVSEGGGFRTQDKVIYVDKAGGVDTATGHRISNPKQTIKAAIDDINADISTSIKAGGSGYVNNTYNNVALTGGTTGTGLLANITVSGGAVTACTITSAATLQEYSIGDILSATDATLGNSGGGSGFELEVTGGGDGMTVIVAAGVYQEDPIQIKRRNVSIIGMALRSCIVHPKVATQGDHAAGNHALLQLNSGSFIQHLTLTGSKANNSGTNTLDSDLPANQGWNFAFYPGSFIVKSPYIQNCTNFSDSEIDNNNLNAHNPAGGAAGDIDSLPTGGGMLCDGNTPKSNSPLRSMVADSYTHVGLNGPGILCTNNGYTQCTSSYAFFNKYHIKCLNGGQANLAASTTDFGDKALVADGKSPHAIFTASTTALAADKATEFFIGAQTARTATPLPWHGTATRPGGNMLVIVNGNTYPILSSSNAFAADEIISGRTYTITNVGTTDFTAIGAASNAVGVSFTASGAGTGTGTVTDNTGWRVVISRPNSVNRSVNDGLNGAVAASTAVEFFLRSMIASSGHTMEYVGSGTDYRALPENGGVPDDTKQKTETNLGKIWTATTDQNGKFTIGGNQSEDPFFTVDQRTGFVTIPEGSIAFNLLSDLTPQLGGNLEVNGKTITGLPDAPAANSHAASKKYVDDQVAGIDEVVEDTTPQLGGNLDVNGKTITSTSNGNITIDPHGTGSVDVSSSKITSLATPTASSDAATKGYVDTEVATAMPKAGGTFTGDVHLDNQEELRFEEATTNGNNYVAFKAPATIASNVIWTLPATDATVNGHALKSDGAGNLSWGTAGGASGGSTDQVFYENDQTVSEDYGITAGKNAMSAGPITVNANKTVTIPANSNWTIV